MTASSRTTAAEREVIRAMREEEKAFRRVDRARRGTSRYDDLYAAWHSTWRTYVTASNALMSLAAQEHREMPSSDHRS